jgi:hypothetical protein
VPAPLLNHLMWSTVLMIGMAIERLIRDRNAPVHA